MNIKITRNPYIIFLPFLLLYAVIVLILQDNTLWGDEIRHFNEVQNLLHGFYSHPAPNIELRNGPGYPLLILPFIAMHVPLVIIKLFNAVFLYLAVVFLFKSLIQFVSFRKALLIGLFMACYYNALDFISMLYSEVFTVFLISLLVYCLTRTFNTTDSIKPKKYVFISGILFGYIALTKIIFGYVLLCMLIGSLLVWLFNRHVTNYKKGVVIMLLAFVTVSPYLVYTYSLTGRVFYWGTSGGNNLYWMSSLAEDEYGSWFPDPETGKGPLISSGSGNEEGGQMNLKNRSVYIPGAEDSIRIRHQADFEEINKYNNGPDRDDAYKKIVMKNIKSYPVKYIKNCFANIGRILFNYPYSYTPQKPGTLIRIPLNGIIVLLSLFCLIPTLLNWRRVTYAARYGLFIVAIYLGGSIFGSAEIRMFTIIVPVLLFWIGYMLQRTIKLHLKFGNNGA